MFAKQYGMQIIVYARDAMGRAVTLAILDGHPGYGLTGIAKVVEAINAQGQPEWQSIRSQLPSSPLIQED